MIVDSSAIMAILLGEPEALELSRALASATTARMSAATWLEAGIVVDRRNHAALSNDFAELIAEASIELIPFTPAHPERARAAYRRFGKGNHPAKLNFGDCVASATAELVREPLLYKGDDFAHAEVRTELAAFAHRV